MTSKKIPNFLNEYEIYDFVGKGAFSSVFNSYRNGNRYAMKRVNSEERFKKCAVNEINLLKDIDSKYIVKMVDNFMFNNIQYLVFEHLYDNLYNFIVKKKNYPNFNTLLQFCYQMAEGLDYLHSNEIIHCDFKLENLMICHDLQNIKIIDLGSSVKVGTKVANNFYIQSRYYRAPEILYKINFSTKIDIWSYGVLITELILRTNILNGKNSREMVYKIADYIDVPNESNYIKSKVFQKYFILQNKKWLYNGYADNLKVKGYREDRLEEYLINGLKDNFNEVYNYQIDNMVAFIHKILDYNYDNRLTAEQCKDHISLIEYSLAKEDNI